MDNFSSTIITNINNDKIVAFRKFEYTYTLNIDKYIFF